MPSAVLQISGRRKQTVIARMVLYPLQVDHLAGEVLGSMRTNVQILIGHEVSISTPAVASRVERFGLNR